MSSKLHSNAVHVKIPLVVALPQCIEGVIGGTDYNHNKVNQWTANIVEHSLTHLVKQGRPFKYIGEPPFALFTCDNVDSFYLVKCIRCNVHMCNTVCCDSVNCTIMQKSGAGLHTANSCYWDTTTDGRRR